MKWISCLMALTLCCSAALGHGADQADTVCMLEPEVVDLTIGYHGTVVILIDSLGIPEGAYHVRFEMVDDSGQVHYIETSVCYRYNNGTVSYGTTVNNDSTMVWPATLVMFPGWIFSPELISPCDLPITLKRARSFIIRNLKIYY